MPRRSAFEFVETVQRLFTVGEIMDSLDVVLRDHGIEHYCFSFLATAQQNIDDVVLAYRFPPGFMDRYAAERYVHDDPALRHVRNTIRPFRWFADAPIDPERNQRAQAVVNACSDFGLVDGVVVPVASPAGRLGQVWFGGAKFHLAEDEWTALHLMALYAFDRVLHLGAGAHLEENLTPREREVLTRVALGRTTGQIASALRISGRTVNEHVVNARRKLGATTRTQAVVIALRERLIMP
jgi:LuxR family quorum sensing-dependent transcriptional regulator